ncbi:hypothetical protein F2Q68_00015203 [Brassica cretica]|uniref:Ubiquitin-like protease family profile domain-containing protein n=1 Tax=Brassica cretica TaxID=69181 RepID=A0A8S9HNC0_BRACR|nr:hypothetical protein F2Q68_00015203 [Brassica cretica]
MPISTRSSKEELLFFSDPTRLERSIRKEKRPSSIDTTSSTSVDTTSTTSIDTTAITSIDTYDRATIDSSTRTSIDTILRVDKVATLVLQRDENGDLHDPGGHLCNAAARTSVDRQQQLSIDRHQQLSTDRHHQPSINRHHFWDQTKLFEFRATQILLLDTCILPPYLKLNQITSIGNNTKKSIDNNMEASIDNSRRPDRQLSMPYRVRLPYLDAHRLKATQNPSQTSVCLKTIKKISRQSAEAPEQEQSTLAETSFVESVDRRHQQGIDRHQTYGYEPAIERQATKEEIPVEKRVKSRKSYIPKHLRREVNKVELDGFHKRVKRVPKDMSFEDAYHKYILGNFIRESRETNKDIELLFNKVNRKPKRTLKKEQYPGKFLIPCSIDSHHLPNALCDTGSAELISCIEMFEDPGSTADSNREPAIPESASVNIRIEASVDSQSSESIDNKPSASDDSQSSESIDAKPSASPSTDETMSLSFDSTSTTTIDCHFFVSIDTDISEQGVLYRNTTVYHVMLTSTPAESVEKPKLTSNLNLLYLLVLGLRIHWITVLLQVREGIYMFSDVLDECGDFGVFWSLLSAELHSLLSAELHRRVRCLAMDGDVPTVRLRPYFDTG